MDEVTSRWRAGALLVFALLAAMERWAAAEPPPRPAAGDELLPPADGEPVSVTEPEPATTTEPETAPEASVEKAPAPVREPAPVVAKSTPPAPPSVYDACRQLRAARMREAQMIADLEKRSRALDAIETCARPEEIARAAPPDQPWQGGTAEVAAGVGTIQLAGFNQTSIGGLSLGVGGFLTRRLALTARVAGATYVGDGAVYVGFVGPSAQVWFNDRLWAGGGIGLGLVAGCGGGGCGKETASGIDLRAGVSITAPENLRALNLSVEATAYDPLAGAGSIRTYSLLAGLQTF